MNDDFAIEIQLTDANGTALNLANVLLDAVLYVQGHTRYRFHAGVTNARGCLLLTFDALDKERLKNQAFSIMDYNTPLQECDPLVDLVVPSPSELQLRQEAIRTWFPDDVDALESIRVSNNEKVVCETVRVHINIAGSPNVLSAPITCTLR